MSDKNFGDYTDRDKQTESIKVALEQMSKEQTPIEELRLEIIKHLPNNPDAVFDILAKANKVTKAKVLEALEREVPKAWEHALSWGDTFSGEEYYETEVKPKYEL